MDSLPLRIAESHMVPCRVRRLAHVVAAQALVRGPSEVAVPATVGAAVHVGRQSERARQWQGSINGWEHG
jgi:hypothetical protein